MTRDDLLAQLRNELRGYLMDSYATEVHKQGMMERGNWMTLQMGRGNEIFARIVAAAQLPAGEIAPKPAAQAAAAQPRPATNGTPAQPRK